jgi:hypothetical protein
VSAGKQATVSKNLEGNGKMLSFFCIYPPWDREDLGLDER